MYHAVILWCVLAISAWTWGEEDKNLEYLRAIYSKIEGRELGVRESKELEKSVAAVSEEERAAAIGILAYYKAKTLGDVTAGLNLLYPAIVTAALLDIAKDKKKSDEPFTPFDYVETWKIDSKSAVSAVWIARLLLQDGKVAQALKIVEVYKKELKGSEEFQGIGAGLAADIAMKNKRFGEAVRYAEISQVLLEDRFKDYGNASYAVNFSLDHIRRSLPAMRNARDEEEFGPAWTAYRNADIARLVDRDYPEAYRRYQEVVQVYPGTIYAEASQAYAIKALFLFSTDDATQEFQRKLKSIRDRLERLDKLLDDLIKANVGKLSIAEQKSVLNQQKSLMDELRSFPMTGPAAAAEALSQAKSFIAKDPQGMYRGEVLSSIGDWYFEEKLKPNEARQYYMKAIQWIEVVEKDAVQNDNNVMEDRVRKVASPPKAMKFTDVWGNIDFSEVIPGHLLNQRTADWYLSFYKLKNTLKSGMCAYMLGDKKEAISSVEIVKETDPGEMLLSRKGMPNCYDRLRGDYKEGRFFATPEELAAFSGEILDRLFIAEFYYEIEDWKRAGENYDHLWRRYKDSFKPDAIVYAKHQLISCSLRQNGDVKAGIQALRKLSDENPKSPTWVRLQFALANMTQNEGKGASEAIDRMDQVIKKRPGSKYAFDALFFKAKLMYFNGRKQESLIILNMLSTKYSNSYYGYATTSFLKEFSQ